MGSLRAARTIHFKDAVNSPNEEGERKERQKCHQKRPGKGHQQGLRQVPRQPRTYCPLCLCCHRLCSLPNYSVCVDVWAVGESSPLQQLSAGAWGWISLEGASSRPQCNPQIQILQYGNLNRTRSLEIHPVCPAFKNVLFFYLPSFNRV